MRPDGAADQRPSALRRLLKVGAGVDVTGTAACLGAAEPIEKLLSIRPSSVRIIGASFASAATSGTATLLRPTASTRAIVTANYAFAVTCVAVTVIDRPPPLVMAVLAGAAASAVALGWGEHHLDAQAG